jgi:hypothetical protein
MSWRVTDAHVAIRGAAERYGADVIQRGAGRRIGTAMMVVVLEGAKDMVRGQCADDGMRHMKGLGGVDAGGMDAIGERISG